jgi:uncharacterized protein DUF3159
MLRLISKEPLRQALGGLAGLTVAVLFAASSGEARGFFPPGILIDAAYGLVFAGSALVGHPLVDTIYGWLYRRSDWRDDAHLRRLFVLAALGWSTVFAVRAGDRRSCTGRTYPACSRRQVAAGLAADPRRRGLHALAAVRRASRPREATTPAH